MPDQAHFVLPIYGILEKVNDMGFGHFLRVHEIHYIGALQEVLRLLCSTDTRYDINNLAQHINIQPVLQARERIGENNIYPKISTSEAIDIYIRCITMLYELHFPVLWQPTRQFYRITSCLTVNILEHRFLNSSLYIHMEVDYTPF